ncbi:hypothetical protein MMC21_008419 [Puttea exsequens]|nr:hypothetical protein [Puttea exsequens]
MLTRNHLAYWILGICGLFATLSTANNTPVGKGACGQNKCSRALLKHVDFAVPFCKIFEKTETLSHHKKPCRGCAPSLPHHHRDSIAACFDDTKFPEILSTACKCISKPPHPSTTQLPTHAPTATTAPSSFKLQATGTGTFIDAYYALLSDTGSNDVITFAPDISEGSSFMLSAAGLFESTTTVTEIANIDAGATNEMLFFNPTNQLEGSAFVESVCHVVGGKLVCQTGPAGMFYVCDDDFALQVADVVPTGCHELTLLVV